MNTGLGVKGGVVLGAAVFTACSQLVTAIVGVPLNVVIAASLGVIAGFAWSDKDMTRREQLKVSVGSILAGCAVTAVCGFAWRHFYNVPPEPNVLAPAALLIALFGPRWVPAVNERIGPWLDKLPFIGKKGE